MITKIAAFSHKGVLIAKELKEKLCLDDSDLSFFNKEDFSGNELHSWVKESFSCCDRIIFIGAVQIAVRLISKEIKSKLSDPAVIVIDDCKKYCIPILSGHVGGANEFASELSEIIGAIPVITTSTDINGKFAIDIFARKNSLVIKNPHKIKDVSSKLIRNESITIYSYVPIEGALPQNVFVGEEKDADVVISPYFSLNENALILIPKIFSLGTGCKKGTDPKYMADCFKDFLDKNNIYKEAVLNMASIDLKKEEEAVNYLGKCYELPLSFFSESELNSVQGNFTSSMFVKSVTNVDNVCERCAKLLSKGEIIIRKTIYQGITFSIAENPITLNYGVN